MNDKIDYSRVEQEIRMLVDFVNTNPDDFANNKLGIPAIPTELAVIAHRFASRDKDLTYVNAFSRYVSKIPASAFSTFKMASDTVSYADLTVTRADALTCLKDGLGSDCERFSNVLKVAEHFQDSRRSVGRAIYDDYTSAIKDYTAVHIKNFEERLIPQINLIIDDAIEANRPKTKLEKELDKIRHDIFKVEPPDLKPEIKYDRKKISRLGALL
ncbi:hypothetical protein N0614_09455 [Pseudomonas aeruginosa]|nr:hypothetical protein [Pseudomonas aeruginosa]